MGVPGRLARTVEHSDGTVEANHATAGVHERFRNRHAVTAADVENP
jgi:hypothetical protein